MWPFKKKYRRTIWDQYNSYLTARNIYRAERRTLLMRIRTMTDGNLERELKTCQKRGATYMSNILAKELFNRREKRMRQPKNGEINKIFSENYNKVKK